MLTNSILSEKLGIPLTKVRRWTKKFLPPDPRATRRSGYAREISNNDAFFVYLGGYIVSTLGFSFHEARKILEILKPWMLSIGLVPDIPASAKREGVDRRFRDHIEINIYSVPDYYEFVFLVDGHISIKTEDGTEPSGRAFKNWFRQYTTYWLEQSTEKDKKGSYPKESEPHKTLPVWSLLWKFNESIFSGEEHIEWAGKWEMLADRELKEIK